VERHRHRVLTCRDELIHDHEPSAAALELNRPPMEQVGSATRVAIMLSNPASDGAIIESRSAQ
jgi:hypothetical protein